MFREKNAEHQKLCLEAVWLGLNVSTDFLLMLYQLRQLVPNDHSISLFLLCKIKVSPDFERDFKFESGEGIEPPSEVLQTADLPLAHTD